MARSIGLDIGARRIGVAVSDSAKIIARPVEIIDRRRANPLTRIAELIAEFEADEVIVGFPYNADGSTGEQALRVRQFAETLRARLNVPLHFCDERFSTGDARDIISARRRKARATADDHIAAAVILQRYLDERMERAGGPFADAAGGEDEQLTDA